MVPGSTSIIARANRKEMTRFVKFAIVGIIGSVVDFGILNLLVLAAGLTPLQANPFSFSAAVISNFTWNRLWTYPESRKFKKRTQLPKFVLVNLVGLAINQLVLGVVLHLVQPSIAHPWDYNFAKAFAIGVVLFWNFGVNRLWTYRDI